MIIKTKMRSRFNPNMLEKPCTEAERAVAIQAERDTRPFVPRKTGGLVGRTEVAGNVIFYHGPGVRALYFGRQVVDPKTKISGFPVGNNNFRSRSGVKKVLSKKKYLFKTGTSYWFWESKKKNLPRWLGTAKREVIKNVGK